MIKATWKGVALLVFLSIISAVLFFIFEEDVNIQQSLYWAVITMTTVGYGDIKPGSPGGAIVAVILACFGILLYGYLGAMIVTIVMESSLSGVFGMNKCKYKNHFVICGWNPLAETVLLELLMDNREVAVITYDQDEVVTIKRLEEKGKVFPIYGDPSKSEVLDQANISGAFAVILTMQDDSRNLITALHIKEYNPKTRMIVRTNRAELKKTMRIAGVTYVVTPHVMAGRLIASAAFEPEVANFVEDVTSATDIGGYDLRQYTISAAHAGTAGGLSKKLRDKTKTTLVAVAKPRKKEGVKEIRYEVLPNPQDDLAIRAGDIIILLGDDSQFKMAEDYLGTSQGR
jgi:voltage-gated potassium channel